MPLSINTNIGALQSQRATTGAERAQDVAMQRLATGVRLNSAADDAAGIAVAARMSSQVRGLDMALRNAQDGLSLARTAEGAIEELQVILQRLRELAVQSSNGSYTDREREALNNESAALLSEVRRISAHTRWDRELNLLDGSRTTIAVQAGMEAGDTVVIPLESLTPLSLGFTGIQGLSPTRPLNSFVDGHDGTFQVVTFQPPFADGHFTLTVGSRSLTVTHAQTLDDIVNGFRTQATAAGYDGVFEITKDDPRIKLTWLDRKGPQDRGTLTRTGDLSFSGNNTLGKIGTQQIQTFETPFNRDYQLTVGNLTVTSSGASNLDTLITQLSAGLTAQNPGFSLSNDAGRLKLTWDTTGPQIIATLRDQTDQTLLTGTTAAGISGKQIQIFDTVYPDGTFSLKIDNTTYTVAGAGSWAGLVANFEALPDYANLGFEILSNSPARGFKLVWKTDGAQSLATVVRHGPFPYGASGANGILERTAVQKLDPGVYSGNFTLVVSSSDARFANYQRSLSVTGATDRADLIAKLQAANVAAGGDTLFTLTDEPPAINLTWNTIGFRPQAVLTRDGTTRSTGNQHTGNSTAWAVQKFEIASNAYGLGQDIELTAGGKTVVIEDATSLSDLISRLNDPDTLKDLPTGMRFFSDDTRLVSVWDDSLNQSAIELKINGDTLRMLTVQEAQTALGLIDSAAEKVISVRARLGAASNRIEYLTGNLLNLAENTRAARSTLEDTDYAAESARLAAAQILSEASNAMLVQANQSQQYVLNLLSTR